MPMTFDRKPSILSGFGGSLLMAGTRVRLAELFSSQSGLLFPTRSGLGVTQGCRAALPPPRLLPRAHRTATSPAVTAGVGHMPGRGREARRPRPRCPSELLPVQQRLHCFDVLIFEAWAGGGRPLRGWGPRGLGACGGNPNLSLLLYTSGKTRFFRFSISRPHVAFQVVAPFPGDSRGCLCSRDRPARDATLGRCVRGSRHLVTDPFELWRGDIRSGRAAAHRPVRASWCGDIGRADRVRLYNVA